MTQPRDRRRLLTTVRNNASRAGVALLLVAGCSMLGPPPMEPLTSSSLEAARLRWEAHGSDSYRLVVRVRAPKFQPALYDVEVAANELTVARNGEPLGPQDAEEHDYSVPGLFELLRQDLPLTAIPGGGALPIDLRAYFDHETGRLVRYRRTIGADRRRVLHVEVLSYEPLAAASSASG